MAGGPPLPRLADVTRLSGRVIRILGDNPGKFTLQGTNTYLIGTGSHRILLDTGEGRPKWKETLSRVLEDERAQISHVLLTHWHPDHVGGIRDALSLSPGAQTYKSRLHLPELADNDIINDQEFAVEGASLRAFHCPGHTKDHMAFILEEEDALFTGDNVLGHGTAVFEDLPAYMDSLTRMRDLVGGRAYSAHGEVIEDGRAKIREYITHRQQREEQILNTMKSDRDGRNEAASSERQNWTAMEIVKVVYKDYPESLHAPAEGGVIQILQKLKGEGRVTATADERYSVIGNDKPST